MYKINIVFSSNSSSVGYTRWIKLPYFIALTFFFVFCCGNVFSLFFRVGTDIEGPDLVCRSGLGTNSLVPPIRNAGQDFLQPITLKKSSPSLPLPPSLSGCPRLVLVPSLARYLSLYLSQVVSTSSPSHPLPVPLSHRVPFPWRPQPKGEGIGKDFEGEKRWERLIWEAWRGVGGGEVGRAWAKDFVMEGWTSRTYEACCRPVEGKMRSDTVENIKFGEVIGWERWVRTFNHPGGLDVCLGYFFLSTFTRVFVSYLVCLFTLLYSHILLIWLFIHVKQDQICVPLN